MKAHYKLLLLAVLLPSIAGRALAQKQGQALVDSLQQLIPAMKEDSNKVKLLNDLAFDHYLYGLGVDRSIEIALGSLALSEKIKWQFGVADANNILAADYLALNKEDKAFAAFQKALSIFRELGRDKDVASVLGNLSVYYTGKDVNRALEYALQALQIQEKIGYAGSTTAWSNNLANIGNIYKSQNNFSKALEYYFRSLRICERVNDKSGISVGLGNIAGIYTSQADYQKALEYNLQALKLAQEIGDRRQSLEALNDVGNSYCRTKEYSKALPYFKKGLEMCDTASDRGMKAIITQNIGVVYRETMDYQKALECFFTTVDIFTQALDEERIANTYDNITRTYILQKKYGEAEKYAAKALALATKIKSLHQTMSANQNLSQIYAATGRYKQSLDAYKTYISIRDSTANTDNTKKLVQAQMNYDFDKKEDSTKAEQDKKDMLAKTEIVKQKNEKRLFMAGGLVMLLVAGGAVYFLYYTRKAKRQIEIQKNRAEQSERFKQQFLANMSHEIRTPMNAVSGMTDVLLEKGPRPDQVEYLTAISKSSDILLHIINDILDLSKIEAGKLELETIDFSLADTLKQVKDTLSYKAEEKGLQFIAHIDSGVTDVVMGDPYRLNQVLINLGGNAIKFTERGGVQINVKSVDARDGKTTLRFSVTDTGMGIPADKLKTLFESFTQVNSSDTRKFGGTGLGLSISKQLVELQGGSISVESKEGSGTTFSFEIAYKEGSVEKLQQRIEQEQKIDGSILNGLRVLVADDNEYNRLVVNETLRLKAKLHVDLVTNGQEAVQMLKQGDYDVILMDVQMPVMDGIEATKYIRGKMPAPKNSVPIIALTASILRADLDMCSESGMNSYVPKPFKAWQLIHTIAEVTGRKLTARESPAPVSIDSSLKSTNMITDLTYLREFCEDDESRMKRYINLYLKAIPAFAEQLNAAVAAQDMSEIAALVHAFKPKWMMMGMRATGELATEIDQQCQAHNDIVFENARQILESTNRSIAELEDKC